ncbi:MAG: MATE family efflux transporter [Clostridiales bacterium]|nr:MATE family efflux transporter [Clostridiales bacterium]
MTQINTPTNETKEFFQGILIIGIPVIIQNLINSLVNMTAVFMVGSLGEVAITSTSLGNSWFFVYILLCGGVTAAGSIFISQHWGNKEIDKVHQYMGVMIIGVAILAAIMGTSSILFSDRIIRIYSNDPAVIKIGASYIRIIGYSYFFTALTNVFVATLRSTQIAFVPMIGTILSLLCNLLLNYCLIFGNMGMPRLGVNGAAIATVIARIIEFLFIVGYTYSKKLAIAVNPKRIFHIEYQTVKQYFRYGSFIILGEAIYGIGNSIYNIAYKYTGTESQAALQIVNSIKSMALVLSIGIGNSASVIIGNLLGQNQLEKAKRFCKKYLIFTPIVAAAVAVILVLFAPMILHMFQISQSSQTYAQKMLYILAFELPFRAINFTIIVGILRAGGDSTYCFKANFCGTWLFGLPMAFLGAVVLKAPVYIVFLMVTADEIGKFFICFPRTIKYKWMRNLTQNN